jgi:hypothetical protein
VVSSPVIRAFVLGLIEGPAAIPLTGPVDRISLARAREAYAAGEAAGDDRQRARGKMTLNVSLNATL